MTAYLKTEARLFMKRQSGGRKWLKDLDCVYQATADLTG